MRSVVKDPNDILDYQVDWTPWLAGEDTIASSEFIVPGGIVEDEAKRANTATSATIWLSGGTVNQTYLVTNRITTAMARTVDQSFRVMVRER